MASTSIRLITRDGKLLATPERSGTDGANCVGPPNSLGKEDTDDSVLSGILSPPLVIELACCLMFVATIVVVGCAYVVSTQALLPMILQNYNLLW